MHARLAEHILETMRRSLGPSIGVIKYQPIGEDGVWRIDATGAKGERWTAADEDRYQAAVMLAMLVGAGLAGDSLVAWRTVPWVDR